jgi:hypothetical protein
MSISHTNLCTKTLSLFMGASQCHKGAEGNMAVTGGCYVGGTEMTVTREQPDVYAVNVDGISHLCEIKVSRTDFRADSLKSHRMYAREGIIEGIGNYRWYVAPYGIIKPEDDLHGWGLIELIGNKFVVTRVSKRFKSDAEAEKALMCRLVRVLGADNEKPGRKITLTCGKSTYAVKSWPRNINFKKYAAKA